MYLLRPTKGETGTNDSNISLFAQHKCCWWGILNWLPSNHTDPARYSGVARANMRLDSIRTEAREWIVTVEYESQRWAFIPSVLKSIHSGYSINSINAWEWTSPGTDIYDHQLYPAIFSAAAWPGIFKVFSGNCNFLTANYPPTTTILACLRNH